MIKFKISQAAFDRYSNIRLLVLSAICLILAFSTEDNAAPSIDTSFELGSFPIEVVETTQLIDYEEPTLIEEAQAVKPTPVVKTGMTVPSSLQSAPPHVRSFVKRWLSTAADMSVRYDVPISSQLAQGGVESDWGRSNLCKKTNNYFGIKCYGKTRHHDHSRCVTHADDSPKDRFRGYESGWDSWMDHANFMLKNNYKHCLKKTSVAQYNVCIEKGGYATGANYGQKLNRVTSDYGLDAFDGLTKAEAAEVAKKIK